MRARPDQPGMSRIRQLLVERREQLRAVPPAEGPGKENKEQRVKRSHTSPFRRRGLARAWSTIAPRRRSSSRRTSHPRGVKRVVAALGNLAVRRLARPAPFLDEPTVEQPLDRFVERPRPEADRAAGALFNVLFDGVAVPGAVRQRQEDVDDREGQWFARLFGPFPHDVSLDDTSVGKVYWLVQLQAPNSLQRLQPVDSGLLWSLELGVGIDPYRCPKQYSVFSVRR